MVLTAKTSDMTKINPAVINSKLTRYITVKLHTAFHSVTMAKLSLFFYNNYHHVA